MFTLAETSAWSEEDTLQKIIEALPDGWVFYDRMINHTFHASLKDQDGTQVWQGEQQDRKILFLDCLGWLRIKDHKTQNPMWRTRGTEVPLYRPSISPSPVPDPPDLDPDEIASVYKTSR